MGKKVQPTMAMQAGEALISFCSSPLSASRFLPTIQLTVSITEWWLTVWINPHTSRHVLGPYQLGTEP